MFSLTDVELYSDCNENQSLLTAQRFLQKMLKGANPSWLINEIMK